MEDYQSRYPNRFRYLHEPIQNASVARNTGWKSSSADWFQFLDADDVLYPQKIAHQLQLANKHQAAWVIGTPVYESLARVQTPIPPWEDAWKGLAHGMYAGQTSANLYSRAAMEGVGGWSENLPDTQDVDLCFRLLQQSIAVATDLQDAVIVRDRPSGKLTQQDPAGILVRHLELRHRLNQFLEAEHKSYWHTHKGFFRMAQYRFIRMLATSDPALAARQYETYLPKHFKLRGEKTLGIPNWDATLANWMGVETFAKMKNGAKTLFPKAIWMKLSEVMKGA